CVLIYSEAAFRARCGGLANLQHVAFRVAQDIERILIRLQFDFGEIVCLEELRGLSVRADLPHIEWFGLGWLSSFFGLRWRSCFLGLGRRSCFLGLGR